MMEIVRPRTTSPPGPPRIQLSPLPGPLPIASTTTGMMPMKYEKSIYSSPPHISHNTPENNNCRLIEYRGAKVAAFTVDGRELICLPQAFELFLKHLVGGLHTVYTKLKRLDITPIVCNVEQVRILRGLGAIQPGVNRCKLISPKEFDVLYEDCTNSSARPGRPPKRSSHLSPTPDTLEKLKKSRLDGVDFNPYSPNKFMDPKKSPLFGNGYHYPPHLATLPFLPMTHPVMSMAMANHLGIRPDGSVIREPMHHHDPSITSPRGLAPSPRHLEERPQDLRTEDNNNKPMDRPLNLEIDKTSRGDSITDKESDLSPPSEHISNGSVSHAQREHLREKACSMDEEDEISDDDQDDDDLDSLSGPIMRSNPLDKSSSQSLSTSYSAAQLLNTENSGISSVETLLMNIQGLLKVASENARHRERQSNYEKAELKMELMKEREIRESLEKHIADEQRNKVILQKRLKKEKRARKRLQEQIEIVSPTLIKPAQSPEDTERHSPEALQSHGDRAMSPDSDVERPVPITDPENRRIESYSSNGLQNLVENFLSSSQKSCSTSANGYLHPPVIKQTESV